MNTDNNAGTWQYLAKYTTLSLNLDKKLQGSKLAYLEICLPLIIMEYSSNNESKGIVKLIR